MSNNFLNSYNELNNSFKRKLVFRFGTGSGFFSEYNNMIFVLIYCLKHKIKFIISSRDSNLSIDKGWEDFFLPFCEETTNKLHVKYNMRGTKPMSKLQRYSAAAFKRLINVQYLTYHLLAVAREQNVLENIFIPELNLNANFVECCGIFINNIWNYQPDISSILDKKIDNIGLPIDYVGIHIRGGDKVDEHKLFSPADYIRKLESLSSCKNVYVATDDYTNLIALRRQYPDYKFFTNCNEKANGHIQSLFDIQSKERKKDSLLDLFIDVDLLSNASMYIGTYSSNIGMYIGMRKGVDFCHCLDFDEWRIW